MIRSIALGKTTTALGLAGLALAGLLVLQALRGPGSRSVGDEPTYRAMAESLALDGDLWFDAADEARHRQSSETLILQRVGDRVGYSKPALYPMLVAPAYRLVGPAAFPLVNITAMVAALGLGWRYLRRFLGRGECALLVVTFAATGVAPVYATWRMSDALQWSLALAGLALALDRPDRSAARLSRLGPALGGVCLGLLTCLRWTNALVALAPVAALAVTGRRRRAAALLGIAILACGSGLALNRGLTGSANPYKAVRASFNAEIGYPAGDAAEIAGRQFDEQRKTYRMELRPRWQPRRSLYSGLYFLIGRHTGVLIYFPAALLLAWAALARGDRTSRILTLAAVALAAFYLIWLPRNYFGGAAFVGNRYLLVAYPALLIAQRRPLSRKSLGLAWGVAALVLLSAAVSIARTAERERSTQSHAYAGLFRWLPIESTAEALDGPRDRYWSDEFLRFADPYATVDEWGFHLRAGEPAAEILIGSPRVHGLLRFIVQAETPEVELHYADWGRRETVRLGPAPGEGVARGVVEIGTSTAWRRHPFPWNPETDWYARVFRLSVSNPAGGPVAAEIRYLGPYRLLPKFYAAQTLSVELPDSAVAGTESRVPIEVRNRGRRPWNSTDAVPVHFRYRLEAVGETGETDRVLVGGVSPVHGPVAQRETVTGSVRVRWPARPGRYRLIIDLVLGGTAWFGEIDGEPLVSEEVTVRSP